MGKIFATLKKFTNNKFENMFANHKYCSWVWKKMFANHKSS